MKKCFQHLHLWLAVPFGLIIAAICFSGAALVFEKELTEGCHRELYYVTKVESRAIPIDQLLSGVAATLPDSVSITGVTFFADPDRACQVALSKPRRASIYVDQYTGEVKGRHQRTPFFSVMFRLHRWLLDSMKPGDTIYVGKLVVGISTIMFVFVLISGIVLWIPRRRRALKNRLKVAVNKGQRRFWYDLHVSGGMYALLFLLTMALTGLTWSFPWYRAAFYRVFGVEMGQPSSPKEATGRGEKKKEKENSFIHWQKVYDQLCVLNPDYEQVSVSNGSASVSFNRWGNQRASDRYAFSSDDGQITETMRYESQEKSGKIRGWIYSVHVGSWGGITTRILAFVAALLGAVLPLTGYYFWLKRLRRKANRAK